MGENDEDTGETKMKKLLLILALMVPALARAFEEGSIPLKDLPVRASFWCMPKSWSVSMGT